MNLNSTPVFCGQINVGQARLAAANTARDGSGTLGTLFTAGLNGSRVDKIVIISAQASAAANSSMVCRVFMTDGSGANPRLCCEIALGAATASNTAIGATATISFPGGLYVKAGALLKCSQSVYAGVQDQTDWTCTGGDY